MNNPRQTIDFSSVLASAVHDMKSSLNLLQQSIDQLGAEIGAESDSAKQLLSRAHYEAARLNTGLVQVLSLYRAEMESLPLNVDECFIEDLLENLHLANENYIANKNMVIKIQQQEGLCRYIDSDLVSILLNDVLVNAMRYGKREIHINAFEQDDYLIITIEDDGEGYPASMLESNELTMHELRISEGRTGLGLFFAKLIASAHSEGDKSGSIHLSNGGTLGGSVFTLKLP